MGKRLQLAGQRFGRLTVMMDWPLGPRGYRLCRCDCGNGALVGIAELRHGGQRSCGCLRIVHGMHGTPEYGLWQGLLQRTSNPRPSERRYAERGVCDRWNPAKGGSFQNFYDDKGPRPSPRHTLERYENNGPYAPWNCGWELPRVQGRNKINSRWVMYNGERTYLYDAAALAGISHITVRSRIKAGWPESEWFTPLRHNHGGRRAKVQPAA
jgi:hypothetical protein